MPGSRGCTEMSS